MRQDRSAAREGNAHIFETKRSLLTGFRPLPLGASVLRVEAWRQSRATGAVREGDGGGRTDHISLTFSSTCSRGEEGGQSRSAPEPALDLVLSRMNEQGGQGRLTMLECRSKAFIFPRSLRLLRRATRTWDPDRTAVCSTDNGLRSGWWVSRRRVMLREEE